jgi:hypothetical protein
MVKALRPFKRFTAVACFLFVTGVFIANLQAAEVYVSAVGGDDNNAGTQNAPFKTLKKAKAQVRLIAKTQPVTVWVRGGKYYLDSALVFTPEDGGASSTNTVTYSAYPGENVIISGGIKVTPTWSVSTGQTMVATIAQNLKVDQLFLNGKRQILARYPNYAENQILQGYNANCIAPSRAVRWANCTEGPGYFRALHPNMWGGESGIITGKDANNNITYKNCMDNANWSNPHVTYRMVENIYEELDTAGEWFYRKSTGQLFFRPPAGVNLTAADIIELASLDELIRIVGTSTTAPVKFLALDGFTFAHTYRTLFSRTYERLLSGDWSIARAGAIFMQNTENITVQNCFFDQIGGNGVFMSAYNRYSLVYNNKFVDAGATCVAICGLNSAVRCPGPWAGSCGDLTPGPLTNDYPAFIKVDNNTMHNFGVFEKQTAAVNISMSQFDTLRHNSIDKCPRAGINFTDGCWGGHILEYNDVFNTLLETSDNGPFNSWGRDRNYIGSLKDDSSKTTLDAMYPTIIRNNRFQTKAGEYGIDNDDGSSNYTCYNNLLLGVGLKLQWGRLRHLTNNIVVGGGYVEFHSNFDKNGFILAHNIFVGTAIYSFCCWSVPDANVSSELKRKGEIIDSNTLWSFGNNPKFVIWADHHAANCTWTQWLAGGVDAHSVLADPQFMDTAHGDYRVKSTSPALALGFKNFPMDSFGVRKPIVAIRKPFLPNNADGPENTRLKVRYSAGRLMISHVGDYRATITSALGRTVKAFHGKGTTTFLINAKYYGAGIYFAVIRSKDGVDRKWFIVE